MINARRLPPTPQSSIKVRLVLSSPLDLLEPPSSAVSSETSSSIALSTLAALLSASGPDPKTFVKIAFARLPRPAWTSHLGDSGREAKRTSCPRAGTTPNPTSQRQPPGISENSQPITYATTWPPVMKRLRITTSLPRSSDGASSEIYLSTASANNKPSPRN